jgi:TRAP-type C4-dicarboxylate transport system permease small subunit
MRTEKHFFIKKILKIVSFTSDIVNRWVKLISKYLLFLLVLTVGLKIIARYLVNLPMPWTEELSRLLLTCIVLLGISIAFKEGELISSKYFASKFNKYFIIVFYILAQLIIFILLVIFFKEGLNYALCGLKMESPILRISLFYSYIFMPISALICLLHQISSIVDINIMKIIKLYLE